MGEKQARRNYSEDFKSQMIPLYNAGSPEQKSSRNMAWPALCKGFGIACSTYYYEVRQPTDESGFEAKIGKVYYENRQVYGSRKIKNGTG